jgi:L-lactate dehydrogenase complex protein LldF
METYALFNKDVKAKSADAVLQQAIALKRHRYNHAFDNAVTQFSNLETAKRRAAFARWKALENLDKYLIEFEANFIKAGGKVIWAQNADEACSEIISIINRSGEKQIINCESFTGEEIGLKEQLTLNRKEWTSGGAMSYRLQLSELNATDEKEGNAPLPLVTAADRKRKTTSDIEDKSVKELAGIGITGADFIVADAGAISISSNDVNTMRAASAVKIHIVVAGIDTVIPTLSDLHIFWPLLSTFGSGQKLSSSNSIIRGPRKAGEADGPAEMYVVLVDNGRSGVLNAELERSVCSCIKCGACLYNDPVFSVIGGEPFRSSWIGPPGAVILPHIQDMKSHGFYTQLSTLSGADSEVCPVNINFNRIILDNRQKAVEKQAAGTAEKLFYFLWKRVMLKREILNLKGIKARNFFMNHIFFKSPEDLRKMRNPAKETFNEIWKKRMTGG